jgi:uncharacterized protein involved in exopolysaccharide biosynthesis
MSPDEAIGQEDTSLTGESHRDVSEPLAGLSAAQGRPNDVPEDTGIFDILLVLARKKWYVIGGTLAGGVLAGVLAFLTPNSYTANAVVMLPPQSQSSASMLLGQLGGFAGMAGGGAFGIKSPTDVYIGILGSRTVEDAVIDRLGLLKIYQSKTRTDARARLVAQRKFTTGKDSLIRIEVRDGNPKQAADIANSFVLALNAKNTEMATVDATQKRVFIEKRLNQEKEALAAAEDAMKSLQQRSGLMQVETQARVAITAIAQLKGQVAMEEVMLETMRLGATPQNVEVLRAEAELGELRAQLKKLEDSHATQSSGDPLVPLSRMPSEGLTYIRQLRELKFHEFVFEFLSKQYEAARFDESKQAPALPVVDWAVPPEKRSGPKRRLMAIEGLMGSAIFCCGLIWLLHSVKRSDGGEKLSQLKRALFA